MNDMIGGSDGLYPLHRRSGGVLSRKTAAWIAERARNHFRCRMTIEMLPRQAVLHRQVEGERS